MRPPRTFMGWLYIVAHVAIVAAFAAIAKWLNR